MIKPFFIVLLIITGLQTSAQKHFTLSGTVSNQFNGLTIELLSKDTAFDKLSTSIKNNTFSFSGNLTDKYEGVSLRLLKDDSRLASWGFFIKDGDMKVIITATKDDSDLISICYVNIPFIEEQKRYDSIVHPIGDSVSFTYNLLTDVKKGFRKEFDKDSLAESLASLRSTHRDRQIMFVKSPIDSYFRLHIFKREVLYHNYHISADSLLALYSFFDDSAKDTKLGKSVYAYLLKNKSLSLNEKMQDFSFLTDSLKSYKLSSFLPVKYVLLCFWASWCQPCINSLPVIKELNEKYSTKGLQIISVSIDKDIKAWNAALKRHALPWLQTCDLPGYINEQSTRTLYNVRAIPRYLLIDKSGILIYDNIQLRDTDKYQVLQNKIDNVLN